MNTPFDLTAGKPLSPALPRDRQQHGRGADGAGRGGCDRHLDRTVEVPGVLRLASLPRIYRLIRSWIDESWKALQLAVDAPGGLEYHHRNVVEPAAV